MQMCLRRHGSCDVFYKYVSARALLAYSERASRKKGFFLGRVPRYSNVTSNRFLNRPVKHARMPSARGLCGVRQVEGGRGVERIRHAVGAFS